MNNPFYRIDLGVLSERLREHIMEDPEAQKYVNDYAEDGLNHFLSQVTTHPRQEVLDELTCQYQCQAWNKLFLEVARL